MDIRKVLDPQADRDDTIISVPEDRKVRTNFGRDVMLDLSAEDYEFEHHMIPTEHVLDGMEWGFKYAHYWQNRAGHPNHSAFDFFNLFKNTALNNFTEYQLPVINLGKETPKEAVCTVFEKVNTGGVTLNVFELVTASFAADNFSLRDDWRVRREHLHSEFECSRASTAIIFCNRSRCWQPRHGTGKLFPRTARRIRFPASAVRERTSST